jgi:hypothetical protein
MAMQNKVYHDMEHLKVGKTPEEAGHFLGFIADTKFYLQCQDLDTRDRGAWALLRPSLHAPKGKLIKITYWYTLLTDRGKIRSSALQTEMTVLPISITCFPGSRYPSTRWLGARPILILEGFLSSGATNSKNLSKGGASTTATSSRKERRS